jgi:glycosyltransferase involved in cell wall biosynthesis
VDLLLDALEQLEPADWEKIEIFRIHGGGPLAKDVRRRAAGLVNAGRPVSVGGYLDKSEAQDLIAASDWLVLPSRIESIPVIFSDAIKLAAPLVATPVGDLPDLMREHEVGVLCESATADGIRCGVRAALAASASAFAKHMGAISHQFSLELLIVPALLGQEPPASL